MRWYGKKKMSVQIILMLLITRFSAEAVEVTFLVGATEYLDCVGHANDHDTYLWTDVGTDPNITIYTVNEEVIKTEEAMSIEKYNNFLMTSSFPVSTQLTIAKVALEDSGIYNCELAPASSIIETYILNVEAEPSTLVVTCSSMHVCPPPPPDTIPSKVDCVCTAVGVYPESLEILGTGQGGAKTVTPTLTGPIGAYDISSSFVVYPTAAENKFRCTVTGYTSTDVEPTKVTTTYLFRPPICELEVTEMNANCTSALLTCVCNNAAPDVNIFTFYDEGKISIGNSQTSNVKVVGIRADLTMHFYCSGCNGVNYGPHSFAENTVTCELQSTTMQPTTSKDNGNTDDCKHNVLSVGLIITVVAVIVILIGCVITTIFAPKIVMAVLMKVSDVPDVVNVVLMKVSDAPDAVNAALIKAIQQVTKAINHSSKADNGSSMANNGSSMANKGSSMANNGSSMANNGSSMANNGSSMANNGSSMANNGSSMANNGSSMANNGSSMANNGSSMANNGSSMANNGSSMADNGQSKGDNGQSKADNPLVKAIQELMEAIKGSSKADNLLVKAILEQKETIEGSSVVDGGLKEAIYALVEVNKALVEVTKRSSEADSTLAEAIKALK